MNNLDKYQNLITTEHPALGRWYGTAENPYQYPGVTTVLQEVLRNKWEGKDTKNRDEAAKKGMDLHEIFRKRFTEKEPVVEEFQAVVPVFDQWVAVKKVKPIYHEIVAVSEKYGVVGRIDLVAEVQDEIMVVDYKTGFEWDNKWGLQVAGAYLMMLAETLGIDIKYLKAGILHIPLRNPKAGKWMPFQHVDWFQRGFLACLELYKHQPRFTELKKIGWPYLMTPCVEVKA